MLAYVGTWVRACLRACVRCRPQTFVEKANAGTFAAHLQTCLAYMQCHFTGLLADNILEDVAPRPTSNARPEHDVVAFARSACVDLLGAALGALRARPGAF